MTRRSGRSHTVAILAIAVVVSCFVGFLDVGAALYLRRAVEEQARGATRTELELMAALLRSPLLRHELSDVASLLNQWAKNRETVVSLRAVTPNGFEVMNFERPGTAGSAYREAVEVHFEEQSLLRLEIAEQLGEKSRAALRFVLQVVAGSVLLTVALVLAVWNTFRKTSLDPLESEVARREAAEHELLLARDELEARVRERTADLALSNERLLHHVQKTPLGYIEWNEKFEATEWNPSAQRIFGYRRAEALGRHAFDLVVPPEVLPQVSEVWEGLLSQTGGAHSTDDNVTRDGRRITCEWYNTPLKGRDGSVIGLASLIQDVTEQKGAQEALRESEAKFRALFDNSGDAIFICGEDARILDANQTACQRLGHTREELRQLSLEDVEAPGQADCAALRIETLRRAGILLFETDHRTRDGRIIPTEVSARLLSLGGEVIVLHTCRDLTERHRAEAERQKLERQMQHVQKLESLGVLAGGIAHDFNNLLMAIVGNADIALRRLSPVSPGRDNVAAIEAAAHRAADLAKQMLAYSGRGQFVVQSLDLGELVEEMTHLLEVSISKKCVLRCNFAANLPPVDADATQLRQVVMNLVINASEAIGERSGVIAVSTGAMECDRAYLGDTWLPEKQEEGLYVYLEVTDTGAGMDRDTVGKIFDPFFTTKFTGRGLGLAAVLGIVRGHNGAVKVYSEPGKGTTFKVLLPSSRRLAVESQAEAAAVPGEWSGSGTILLVDDEESVRSLGKEMLEELGFDVLTAPDGKEALEVFRARQDEIVCVLLDLTMPHMDGEEAFREMRRVKNDVRVLLCSGYSEHEVTQRFVGKGLGGFLQKPYTVASLCVSLRKVLSPPREGSSTG